VIAGLEYAAFLDREYLATFVAEGGGAVKFVVAADEREAANFRAELAQRAASDGYVLVPVDAVHTRVHMMDEIFFSVARQIDWDGLARTAVRAAWADAAHPCPEGANDVSVAAMAARFGVDATELTRDVNRHLQQRIYRDYCMVQEFRVAMLRLCQAQLGTGQVTEAEHQAVLSWLRGELRQMSVLQSALIYRKIARNNARHLLFSLAHWLSINNATGLLLEVDIRRLGFARRPLPGEREGLYYTKAALLDAYELLRQLVDNTDELMNCCVVVIAAPEFVTDQNRGLDAYQALKLRIFDEVRDRVRDNPYSSLVRLGAA
jgi:P-loop Domain of unknown function (DUF2791)